MKQPKTLQEKRAVKFGVDLLTKHGYGYTINIASRTLAKELTEKGASISFITVREYWKCLERLGYAKREMTACVFGVTYYLNKYAFNKLINAQ